MVEHHSTTPWMMFTSARLLKDHVCAKSNLAQQMHGLDGLFGTAIMAMKPVCNRFDLMLDAVRKYQRTDI